MNSGTKVSLTRDSICAVEEAGLPHAERLSLGTVNSTEELLVGLGQAFERPIYGIWIVMAGQSEIGILLGQKEPCYFVQTVQLSDLPRAADGALQVHLRLETYSRCGLEQECARTGAVPARWAS